ncbi:MAG: peptidoglycan-binding protein [Planctomycetota bacterium]
MMADTEITRRDYDKTWSRRTDELHRFILRGYRALILEVDEVHFHHDSAVFLPDYGTDPSPGGSTDDEIAGLAVIATCYRHAEEHPDQKLLVAGHTDTSGPDAYNVGLSHKRATNVYHVLEGNRAEWVASSREQCKVEDYQQILKWVARKWGWDCDPGAVNNVLNNQTRTAIRRFQEDYNVTFDPNIGVDGVVGEETWGAFFDVYMDGIEDILGVEPAELQRLQGSLNYVNTANPTVACGENFPIDAVGRTNYRSRTNRRVELLFFDPGEEPTMPCFGPPGNCTAPSCILYQRNPRIYTFRPIPVSTEQTAKLHVVFDQNDDHDVDTSDPRSSLARVGLWDHAFDPGTGNVRNNVAEAQNFVGADSRRFYFRLSDPRASGDQQVQWRTRHESDNTDDDAPASQDITLTETAAGSGVFVSKAAMLVADNTDANQATDSGLTSGDVGNRNRGQSNHRIRRITVSNTYELDNMVVATYRPTGRRGGPIARVRLFERDPEERKRMAVHLVNVRTAVGAAGNLTAARRDLAIETFHSIYAAGGIAVDIDEILLDPPASCIGWAARHPGSPVAADPSVEEFRIVGGDLVPSASERDIMNAVRALPGYQANDIYIIYVQHIYATLTPGAALNSAGGGESFPDSWSSVASGARGFGVVALASGVIELADVHEATHLTTNLRNNAGGHYNVGGGAPGPIEGRNLMHRYYLDNTQGVRNPKRLWNERATDPSDATIIPAQIDAIRASRFVHDF